MSYTRLALIIFGIAGIFVVVFTNRQRIIAKAPPTAAEVNFIFPYRQGPTSFDPMDLDQLNNLIPGRMLFLTPLENSLQGEIVSTLLEDFAYDPASRIIRFQLRPNLRYADGSVITLEDLELAILRFAFFHPDFPVLREIVGLQSWLQSEAPLLSRPSGVELDSSTLRIRLGKDVLHPLYRFTLEVFSVLPSRCFDRRTGRMQCANPPASGYYESTEAPPGTLRYRRRESYQTVHGANLPQVINMLYPTGNLDNFLATQTLPSVAFASEQDFTSEELRKLEATYQVDRMPASFFATFVLNPRHPAFASRECRRWFADRLRSQYGMKSPGRVISSSLFPRIVPGYINSEDLGDDLQSDLPPGCLEALKKDPPVYARRARNADAEAAALQVFGNELVFHDYTSFSEIADAFAKGSSHILMQKTGFWPLDPVGDLQMLFTPGFHKHLNDVTSDPVLREQLDQLALGQDEVSTKRMLQAINRHIRDEAVFNVFHHFSYVYIRSKGAAGSPQGATSSLTVPYPWQLFDIPDSL